MCSFHNRVPGPTLATQARVSESSGNARTGRGPPVSYIIPWPLQQSSLFRVPYHQSTQTAAHPYHSLTVSSTQRFHHCSLRNLPLTRTNYVLLIPPCLVFCLTVSSTATIKQISSWLVCSSKFNICCDSTNQRIQTSLLRLRLSLA